ncbi:MAG: bifunctional DNA-formamidopyrimidine glycosylase/DNA-(apurinic or apyrimidinic site) lyase [Actinomycetota bacterium]
MPELPEVETIKRGLAALITGKKIKGVETDLPKMIRGKTLSEFSASVTGTKITGVNRRGKHLLINLSNGLTIVGHLKMTGQLLVVKASDPVEKWTHIIIHLSDGRDLRFRDIRQFGYLELYPTAEIGEAGEKMPGLGPEPLSRSFTRGVLDWQLKKHPKPKIKSLLLNQSFIAGLGNIYADEVLYYARVRPTRRAGVLTAKEKDRIYAGIKTVLDAAIAKKGTTVRNFVDAEGEPGGYLEHLKVYGRTGEYCPRCDEGKIKRVVVGGRSTHYCPKCQK